MTLWEFEETIGTLAWGVIIGGVACGFGGFSSGWKWSAVALLLMILIVVRRIRFPKPNDGPWRRG